MDLEKTGVLLHRQNARRICVLIIVIFHISTVQQGHTYLLLSVVEVRPRLGARVSVARIRVNERLRLLDFSLQNYPKGMKPVKINLFYALSQLYSKPVTEDDDTLDYIPTQYIAEFVKRIGYDGIVFKSSLYNDENSVNVVIFNFDKCEAVGSVVYDVTRNDYTCEMEDPVSELRLNFQLQLTPDNN